MQKLQRDLPMVRMNLGPVPAACDAVWPACDQLLVYGPVDLQLHSVREQGHILPF